uniref:Uncharacterized protein n=1 Tax=viral metagenome TaxID=1070528 RepID=A0A6C0IEQ7_9ZZZZ
MYSPYYGMPPYGMPPYGMPPSFVDREKVPKIIDTDMKKDYKRPILDIEQRGPINDILEANYNYILDNVTTGTPTRETNETLDKTLLVYEFINGEGVLPKRNAQGTNSVVSPYAERAIGGRRSRRSRRSRKSKKSSRRNRH